MKTYLLLIATAIALQPINAQSSTHPSLELGLNVTPTVVLDDSIEFFSSNTRIQPAVGGSLRLHVATVGDVLEMLPVLSYRFAITDGTPLLTDNTGMESTLKTHDIHLGLRLRGWLYNWFGAFAEASGGLAIIDMNASRFGLNPTNLQTDYHDRKTVYSMAATLGTAFRISPAHLKRRGIHRFNLGGEIGAGFIKRKEVHFAPDLSGGDDNTIPASTTDFGDIDLTGITVHLGLNLHFF